MGIESKPVDDGASLEGEGSIWCPIYSLFYLIKYPRYHMEIALGCGYGLSIAPTKIQKIIKL